MTMAREEASGSDLAAGGKRVVGEYIECSNRRDLAGMRALRTADFVAHVPAGGPLDEAQPIGAHPLERDFEMITSAFPDLQIDVEDIVAEGDRVVARATLSGTHTGDLGAVGPSGKRIRWDTVHVYRLDSSQIAEAWFVTDTLGLLRQVGAIEVVAKRVDEA